MKLCGRRLFFALHQRWSPLRRPWPRRHILKIFALASKLQVFENCPILGSKKALFFEPLKFAGKRQNPRGKFSKTFLCFPQVEIA